MLFHIRLTDYPVPRRTPALRDLHYKYLDDHADHLLARGPTQSDDGTVMRSSLYYADFPNWAAAQRFIDEEPTNRAGVYMNVELFAWTNVMGRRMSDFKRKEGQVFWYLRGYAKPDAHLKRTALFEQHKAYLQPHDAENFILRGGVIDAAGNWSGSANLIALPDRKAAEAFCAEEPFCKNGLFERMVIERFKPGGPGN